MKKIFLLLIVLVGCGEDPRDPEELYNLKNLGIKFELEPQQYILNEYSIPLRGYEVKSFEVPHFEIESNKDISLFVTLYDKSGKLTDEELFKIVRKSNFECQKLPSRKIINPGDGASKTLNFVNESTFEFQMTTYEKVESIRISCGMESYRGEWGTPEYQRTEDSFLYPGYAKNELLILPENPLDEVIPMLNELGFSPFNNYEGGYDVDSKFNFKPSRDKFSMGFVNMMQDGITIFWNERGITNIVFPISYFKASTYGAIDSKNDIELLGAILSKLTDIDSNQFQKFILCKWSSNEIGSCDTENLSKKFRLSSITCLRCQLVTLTLK